MTEVQGFRTDEDLFALARNVLSEAGFAQEEVELQDTAVLLAENEYCIVALAATPTMDDLVAAEPHLEAYLNKGVGGADIGPKIWDVYVVLLTQEKPSEQGSGFLPLFDKSTTTHAAFDEWRALGSRPPPKEFATPLSLSCHQ